MGDTNLPAALDAHLATHKRKAKRNKWIRFTAACLGAIPWIGSVFSAAAAAHAESEQGLLDDLQNSWLSSYGERLQALEATMTSVVETAESAGEEGEARLEDQSFLKLVDYGFRVWDGAPTELKREQVRRILSNATVAKTTTDDMLRLFLTWVQNYDDVHFKIISALHRKIFLTGAELWMELDGRDVRHDSAEADLFKLILRDLSTGGVIRQHREVSPDGRAYRQSRGKGTASSPFLSSPIEGEKPYELTQMGHLFVGYALDEPTSALAEGNVGGEA